MARPYRIVAVEPRRQVVKAKRESRGVTTRPDSQTMVFPSFEAAMSIAVGASGFFAEVPMQVSERVLGFREVRGAQETAHRYGPASSHSRRALDRFAETTGVRWSFDDPAIATEAVGTALADAFSLRFGVHRTDLGVGPFFSKRSPRGEGRTKGVCIYDATHGSLRLTERLGRHLTEVIETALSQIADDPA